MKGKVLMTACLKFALVFIGLPLLLVYALYLFNVWYFLPLVREAFPSQFSDIEYASFTLFFEGIFTLMFGISIVVGCGTSFSGLGTDLALWLTDVRTTWKDYEKEMEPNSSVVARKGWERPGGAIGGLVLIIAGVLAMLLALLNP
jgi:hypothetical protein